MTDEPCADCEDHVKSTDDRLSSLLEKVREGKRLSRSERSEVNTWLLLRCADYLNELGILLRAPNEIPVEVSEP